MVNFMGANIVQLHLEVASGKINTSDIAEEVILSANAIDTIFSKTNLHYRLQLARLSLLQNHHKG